ncbi:MAG TPA: hypothetical protein VEB60_03040, partial [Candidatus Paceibacterota bacterium]|nr:hypothetical protein [Candidatus Paceibacterota bacterium]
MFNKNSRSSGGRGSSFNGSRGGGNFHGRFRGSSAPRGGKRPGQSQFSDVSKFINKAVITEEVEHFVPDHKFTDFQIDERLKNSIVSKGYENPTPIQDRAI